MGRSDFFLKQRCLSVSGTTKDARLLWHQIKFLQDFLFFFKYHEVSTTHVILGTSAFYSDIYGFYHKP